MSTADRAVFITGVSTGIGYALAEHALALGYTVYGVSRRIPQWLPHPNFRFAPIDLSEPDLLEPSLEKFFDKFLERRRIRSFEFVFLNAGSFGVKPSRAEAVGLPVFRDLITLNLLSNKAILDFLIKRKYRVKNYVVSSSVSAIRQRAGMLAYASSKAALNAMIAVYALENKESFFAVLGLCNVCTNLAEVILDVDETFPELWALKQRAKRIGYLVSPAQRAADIFKVVSDRDRFGLQSGVFAEIRLLLAEKSST